jgi:4-amino-4-deoxy-L-arabinose transferase-like glycosyltransferase
VRIFASRLDGVLIAAIVAWGLALLVPGLAHDGIHNWDEVFHQAAARGTYDTFFYPHLWADPLVPPARTDWMSAQVWLHKPTLPLWLSAALMHVIGVTPLASRLVALLAQLAAALCIYVLARPHATRVPAALAAAAFLALPFGWQLTQGVYFADIYDCTLAGFVALTVFTLCKAVEQDSLKWAALSGVMLGCAHLSKTVLGLAPLGVAGVMTLAALVKLLRGPRLTHFLAMGLAALATTGPWNLYCYLKWTDLYRAGMTTTFGHLDKDSGVDVGPWHRPADAVFNGLLNAELAPLAPAVTVLAGLWLLWRAAWKREPTVIACTLWLWSTWLVHSWASAKVPAQVWSAVPAAFIALAILAADAWKYPALAGATAAAAFVHPLVGFFPGLSKVRAWLPAKWEETRLQPYNLAEGLTLAAGAALALYLVWRLAKKPWPMRALGLLSTAALCWFCLVKAPRALWAQRPQFEAETLHSHVKEVGLAVDAAVPKKSVLFLQIDHTSAGQFELQSLLFWSGRMTYQNQPQLIATARERGYRPYLVSPVAEAFLPVPGVPAHAGLRAWNADAPAAPPGIPEGATPLALEVDGLSVKGVAVGRNDRAHDRWAFFVSAAQAPGPLHVTFALEDGSEQGVLVQPEASLRGRGGLAGVPWFVLPLEGPRRAKVKTLLLGTAKVAAELPKS